MWLLRAVNPSRPQQVNSDTYCSMDICDHHPGSSEPLGKKSPELSALKEMEVTGSHGELVYKFEGPYVVLTANGVFSTSMMGIFEGVGVGYGCLTS